MDAPVPSCPPLPPGALAALRQGHMIEAIKIVREAEGLGLKEAKDRVDRYVAGEPAGHPPGAALGHPSPSGQPLPPGVAAALREGRKIEAIKLVREAQGIGLKEAKDHVERYLAEDPLLRGRADGRRARGCLLAIAALVALAGTMVFLYFRAQG